MSGWLDTTRDRDEAEQAEERRQEIAAEERRRPKDDWQGVYPGMCADPEICRGYSHCPRDYSCCE